MIRSLLLIPAFAVLASCQMVDQPEMTTREQRLALGFSVIDACQRSECGRLDLDRQLVEDYSIITDLTHVTAPMTSYSDFSDLPDIAPMTQLRELHIGATNVTDLSGLSNFPNLTLLHIQNLPDVTDFTPVRRLRGLTELAIGGNSVDNTDFVRDLPNLTSLSVANSKIASLDGLRGNRSIRKLDLGNTALPDDISVLTSMRGLKQITVDDYGRTDAQQAVIDTLEANGVEIMILPSVIVC